MTSAIRPPRPRTHSIAAGLKRSRRKGLRDMLAAQILLQNYLDAGCPAAEATALPLDDPSRRRTRREQRPR